VDKWRGEANGSTIWRRRKIGISVEAVQTNEGGVMYG
jgi:hypothetical protein